MKQQSNFKNKIKKGIITLGLIGTITSCASIDTLIQKERHEERERVEQKVIPSPMNYQALKILGVENNPSRAYNLREGYLTTESGKLILDYLAAIKSGNNDFDNKNIIHISGKLNPGLESTREDYNSILKRADKNGDKIITRKEIYNLEREMRQEYK